MTKLQKLAQLELARRAIARELAEEEMERVAGGSLQEAEAAVGTGTLKVTTGMAEAAEERFKEVEAEPAVKTLEECLLEQSDREVCLEKALGVARLLSANYEARLKSSGRSISAVRKP